MSSASDHSPSSGEPFFHVRRFFPRVRGKHRYKRYHVPGRARKWTTRSKTRYTNPRKKTCLQQQCKPNVHRFTNHRSSIITGLSFTMCCASSCPPLAACARLFPFGAETPAKGWRWQFLVLYCTISTKVESQKGQKGKKEKILLVSVLRQTRFPCSWKLGNPWVVP